MDELDVLQYNMKTTPIVILTNIFSIISAFSADVLDPKVISQPTGHGPYLVPIQMQRLGFNKTNGKIFYIPLSISGKRSLNITIGHGYDNSGDKKMSWRLIDPITNKTIASGDAGKEGNQTWTVNKITSLRPTLILEDADSKFDGKAAGNGFFLQVNFPK